MSTSPRIPSPESIRQSMDDLRSGKLSPVDHETREEVLNLAQMRIEAVLPDEVRTLLAQYAPQVIEAYGLLLRWQAEREKYPQPATKEGETQGDVILSWETEGGQRKEKVLDSHFVSSGEEDDQEETLGGNASMQSGFQVVLPSSQDPIHALYQAVTGPLTAMHQLSQATHQPTSTFQAGPKMTLDQFQGAYKGLVTLTEGRGKQAKLVTETIAVIKDIYETEQRMLAEQENSQVVEDPAYWLARQNMMSVYIVGECPEVGWLLGDYDPTSSGIPAGIKPTPEQIVAYLHNPDDDEHWEFDVIKMHLRTPQQKAWLEQHDLTLADILHGQAPINLSAQLVSVFFQDWNAKLGEQMYGY